MTVTVVIPTVGRPSLQALLDALAADGAAGVAEVVLADDRAEPAGELAIRVPTALAGRVRVVRSGGRGPAAARNAGWRTVRTPWVAFLDDDVLVPVGWSAALRADLDGAAPTVGGSQGTIVVPLPADRRPTDWERNTAGLADAAWATADMAYRREALAMVGGFDERFPRAYREDADLALRVLAAGWRLTRGRRHVQHPVRPADAWVSVRVQAGNADNALMRRRHGRHWRTAARAPVGRLRRHVAVTAAGALALGAGLARRPGLAAAAAGAWLVGSAELAWARIAPGPRTAPEVATMLATSVAIPPAATWHALRGEWRHRGVRRARASVTLS